MRRSPPHELHDQAGAARHVRHGRVDPLACIRGRDVGAGARRQRVRRGRRHRPDAAGRRAASERAWRRGAGAPLPGRPRRADCALRPGVCARRGDDRALPRSRPRARSRDRCARGLRPRCLRRLAAAVGAVRDLAARGRARVRDRLRGARLPARRRDPRDDRPHRGAAAGLARLERPLPARTGGRRALPQPGPRRRRTGASSRSRAEARASRRSRTLAVRTTRDSSPRRSTGSPRPRAGSSPARTWRAGARRSSRSPSSSTAG